MASPPAASPAQPLDPSYAQYTQQCSQCSVSNPSSNAFCNECGGPLASKDPPPDPIQVFSSLTGAIASATIENDGTVNYRGASVLLWAPVDSKTTKSFLLCWDKPQGEKAPGELPALIGGSKYMDENNKSPESPALTAVRQFRQKTAMPATHRCTQWLNATLEKCPVLLYREASDSGTVQSAPSFIFVAQLPASSSDGTRAAFEEVVKASAQPKTQFAKRLMWLPREKLVVEASQQEFTSWTSKIFSSRALQTFIDTLTPQEPDEEAQQAAAAAVTVQQQQQQQAQQILPAENLSVAPMEIVSHSEKLVERTLPNGVLVQLVKGNIAAQNVSVVVNAANSHLDHKGGVAAAIATSGGDAIVEECKKFVHEKGPLCVGGVAVTSGGKLHAKHVIHAVGPDASDGYNPSIHDAQLCATVANVMQTAQTLLTPPDDTNKAIALPLISSGIFKFPKEKAAALLLTELLTKASVAAGWLKEVHVVAIDDATCKVLRDALEYNFCPKCVAPTDAGKTVCSACQTLLPQRPKDQDPAESGGAQAKAQPPDQAQVKAQLQDQAQAEAQPQSLPQQPSVDATKATEQPKSGPIADWLAEVTKEHTRWEGLTQRPNWFVYPPIVPTAAASSKQDGASPDLNAAWQKQRAQALAILKLAITDLQDAGAGRGLVEPIRYAQCAIFMARNLVPVFSEKHVLLEWLRSRSFGVISAPTGVGKTLLVPQLLANYIYANDFRPVCVLVPTRAMARQMHSTFSALRSDGNARPDVGYVCGFGERSRVVSPAIVFVTHGALLPSLEGDFATEIANSFSCVVVDEAHSRSKESDSVLAALKHRLSEIQQREKRFKLIIMSATIDVPKLLDYFKDAPNNAQGASTAAISLCKDYAPPILFNELVKSDAASAQPTELPSPEYVSAAMTECGKLAHEAVKCVVAKRVVPGNILVFVPGIREANQAASLLQQQLEPALRGRVSVYALYADQNEETQKKIRSFACPKAEAEEPDIAASAKTCAKCNAQLTGLYCGKCGTASRQPAPLMVIFSTNVAEAGLTIPGVRYVIDSCLERVEDLDPRGRRSTPVAFISKFSALQRQGRTGRDRTAPGVCVRLLPPGVHSIDDLEQSKKPALQVASLEAPLLQMLRVFEGDQDARSKAVGWLDAPPAERVDRAFQRLQKLGAVDGEGEQLKVTEKGKELLQLPLDDGMRLRKFVQLAREAGVGTEAAIIASLLTAGAKQHLFRESLPVSCRRGNSDHLSLLAAYQSSDAQRAATPPAATNQQPSQDPAASAKQPPRDAAIPKQPAQDPGAKVEAAREFAEVFVPSVLIKARTLIQVLKDRKIISGEYAPPVQQANGAKVHCSGCQKDVATAQYCGTCGSALPGSVTYLLKQSLLESHADQWAAITYRADGIVEAVLSTEKGQALEQQATPPAQPQQQTTTQKCRACGNSLPATGIFCGKCAFPRANALLDKSSVMFPSASDANKKQTELPRLVVYGRAELISSGARSRLVAVSDVTELQEQMPEEVKAMLTKIGEAKKRAESLRVGGGAGATGKPPGEPPLGGKEMPTDQQPAPGRDQPAQVPPSGEAPKEKKEKKSGLDKVIEGAEKVGQLLGAGETVLNKAAGVVNAGRNLGNVLCPPGGGGGGACPPGVAASPACAPGGGGDACPPGVAASPACAPGGGGNACAPGGGGACPPGVAASPACAPGGGGNACPPGGGACAPAGGGVPAGPPSGGVAPGPAGM